MVGILAGELALLSTFLTRNLTEISKKIKREKMICIGVIKDMTFAIL